MTHAQRTRINRQNAQKSTGPKTEEGKERARQNALKHGLCTSKLALPTEDPVALQTQYQDWIDHLQPQGPVEVTLVEDAARGALKLKRCARREAAVVAEQVRHAQSRWDDAQEDRLSALRLTFVGDPEGAVLELQRFGAGRRWLLSRWRFVAKWFLTQGYCVTTAIVEEALRLLGTFPPVLRTGPLAGYEFRLYNALAQPEGNEEFVAWLLSPAIRHPDYVNRFGDEAPDPAGCREAIKALVTQMIEELEQLERERRPREWADRNEAPARAEVPADGPDQRLALRYETMARSSMHKALKELDWMQSARWEAEAEDEADSSPAQNEANPEAEPDASNFGITDCVQDQGTGDAGDQRQATGNEGAALQGTEAVAPQSVPVVTVAPVAPAPHHRA